MANTCLITGASGGIARATTARLAAAGWRLVLATRDAAKLAGAPGTVISVDTTTPEGAASALAQATAALGAPPQKLVHAVGSTLIAPLARTRLEQYRSVMTVNLDSAFYTAQAWLGALTAAKLPGAAVFYSSVVAAVGVANHAAIAAAKGGVEALVRSLAYDYAAHGIRINAIAPGLTRTPMTERMLASEAAATQISAQYPLGRYGEADEAAALTVFLLGDEAGWITGQIIGFDGGFGSSRPLVRAV